MNEHDFNSDIGELEKQNHKYPGQESLPARSSFGLAQHKQFGKK